MNVNEVVYVGNVPKQATVQELADFFKDVGTVIKVSFMRENRNDCRTKVGFVLFENEMQALKACSFDQTIFQWNRVIVALVNDERHFWAGHTVIVRNISAETSEEDLYEAFGRYGTIEAVQIPTNNFAYVGFKDQSAAIAAQRLNHTILGKNKISVQVLQRNIRIRLEDLDSFKTPRVYNELTDAKLKHNYAMKKAAEQNEIKQSVPQTDYNDYDEDEEDNRVYDPVTNCFYDKPPEDRSEREQSVADDQFAAEIDIPASAMWDKDDKKVQQPAINLDSPDNSPERDILDSSRDDVDLGVVGIFRSEVRMEKLINVLGMETAVKVQNIPREVYDENVIHYFSQYGPIMSVKIGYPPCSVFNKNYKIIYQKKRSAEKVLQYFMRKCEFSGVVCTMFTLRLDETLQELPGQCVLVNLLSPSVVFEDVVEAFRGVGEVIYVQRDWNNRKPTVVHFRYGISFDCARSVTCIDGDKVKVVPVSQEAYRIFAAENAKLRAAVKSYNKKPLKNVRMVDIQMKESRQKSTQAIFRTSFNESYRNPNPQRFNNEVVIYNCPPRTTLQDIRRHFINVAFVTEMRHEESPYDDTWKLYVSFGSFLDAFSAARMKGLLNSYPIFKHLATEKPKLDIHEALVIECESEYITVNKMYTHLVSHGAITFLDKISPKQFVAVCREMKLTKKLFRITTLAKTNCEIIPYRTFLSKTARAEPAEHLGQIQLPNIFSWQTPQPPMDGTAPSRQHIMNDERDNFPSSRENRNVTYINEWEHDSRDDERDSAVYRRNSVDMELVEEEPDHHPHFNRQDQSRDQPRDQFDSDHHGNYQNKLFPSFERNIDVITYANPPAPNEKPYGMPPRERHYAQGWASGGPPVMVPPPVNRHTFMGGPSGTSAPFVPNVYGTPVPIPPVTIHHIRPDPVPAPVPHPVPHEGDLREYLAEKRNTRPRDVYDPLEVFDQQRDERRSDRSSSPNDLDRMESYIREKERDIQRRLALLDKQLIVDEEPTKKRSVSPTDRKAHDRLEQIRLEKVEISRKLGDLRKRNDYKNTQQFVEFCERQSELDRECVEIQRQLNAKKLWLSERERSLSRDRHEQEEQRDRDDTRRVQRSRSRSRVRRRSSSSDRYSRGRVRGYRRSRSMSRRSPPRGRYRRSRSSSRDRNRRRSLSSERGCHYNRPRHQVRLRPESLMREMRQLGKPREGKTDHTVYVGNIAEGVRDDELKATFDRYGRITEIDFELRWKYGEVYIDYHQREDAFKALEMNRVKICGKRLRVALNCRKPANREGYTVVVEMPEAVPERDLYARFDGCGDIEFIWYYDNSTIATITFERPESMLMALAVRELHNRIPIIVREYVESER